MVTNGSLQQAMSIAGRRNGEAEKERKEKQIYLQLHLGPTLNKSSNLSEPQFGGTRPTSQVFMVG